MQIKYIPLAAYAAVAVAVATPNPHSASSRSRDRSWTQRSATDSSATQYFITFGDSYSQTGFEINGTLANAANPLGNPAFPGYTTSGGANWIGLLISEYNLSSLLSYNFAYGGATTDASLVAPYESTVLSFVDQVTQFSKSIASHPTTTPWTSENTLFGVWMGVNDVGNAYSKSNVIEIIDAIMVVYFKQLQILYDAGARNFVLLGVPPTQESPMMLSYGAEVDAQVAKVIAEYNDRLASKLASFTSANSGVTAKLVNTTIAFQTAIDSPTAYGAADATCYKEDGTSCLWWNSYHPALAIHKLVAAEVAAEWEGKFFKQS